MRNIIREHILVCLSSAPSNANTIRAAAKLSRAFGGTMTALYVQTKRSDQMGAEDRQRLQRHARLAEKLGASVSTVTGDDVAFQIAEFARISKATKVVLGRSAVPKGRLFAPKPLTEQLVELAPYLDVYIIPDSAGKNKRKQNPATKQRILPSIRDMLITIGILALSTVIGFAFHRLRFTEANTITVYILGVLLTALFTKNYVCSVISSLAGVLLFNFFFTEPRLSFQAYESGYPVTFAIMLFASLLTGTLANRLAVHVKRSTQTAWRTQVLLETTQQLGQAEEETDILEVIADQLLKLLNRPIRLQCANGTSIRRFPDGEPIEDSTDTASQRFAFQSGGKQFGEVFIYGNALEPLESGILHSILGEGALAIESRQNARQKEEAAVLAKNEQLRANLLRSISHDLRTPLTSISGNAENLLASADAMDESDKRSLLTDIYEDSIWLIRLVENLLSITKIDEGQARLNMTTELVDEVIAESLRHIRAKTHTLETDFADEILLTQMDARLISQVIINLVDNAVKYTPEGSKIRISTQKQGKEVLVRVADNGPGIPDEIKSKVFDLFYTGSGKNADCRRSMGLGLHLCRSIIHLHGGEITLTDNTPHGCVFAFTLPISEVTFHEQITHTGG